MKLDDSAGCVSNDFSPGGALHVANEWVEAVLRRSDLRSGWPLMTADLRYRAVAAFVSANRTHPALAGEEPAHLVDELSGDHPSHHRLWGGYALTQLSEFEEAWGHLTLANCGWGSRLRPLSLDREEVVYADKGSPDIYRAPAEGGGEFPGIGFVMHFQGGAWLVDDFKTYPPSELEKFMAEAR